MRIDTRFWFTFIFCILASVSTVLIYLNHNKNLRLNGGQDKVSSVRNATLGFEKILSISKGTPWRVDGLRAAAKLTALEVTIPEQPKWSKTFINAYNSTGVGGLMALLAYVDMLKHVIMSGYQTVLLLEDDADWDVNIKDQMSLFADGLIKLTGGKGDSANPYGSNWDVLWIGHCDEVDSDQASFVYQDVDTVDIKYLEFLDPKAPNRIIAQHSRKVQHLAFATCSWAFALTQEAAHKLLDHFTLGTDMPADLLLRQACTDGILDCYTALPTIFNDYKPQEHGTSLVNSMNDNKKVVTNVQLVGWTRNVLHSARCKALFHTTCYDKPKSRVS